MDELYDGFYAFGMSIVYSEWKTCDDWNKAMRDLGYDPEQNAYAWLYSKVNNQFDTFFNKKFPLICEDFDNGYSLEFTPR